ncbi:hypothetical protein Acr_06g0009290 [Actinidia rufa]|uniref:Uncharacterized protein n=1 Tax=Actinidia rufa TaxID=165716 RepID=A0A7J0ESL2_9ERIC|nr:hypothetical protein Acr_06g0009290 [Actinidia rufa]
MANGGWTRVDESPTGLWSGRTEIRRRPMRSASLRHGRVSLRLGWGRTTALSEPQSRSIRVQRPPTGPVRGAPEVDWCPGVVGWCHRYAEV